jgi:hypothetical protein
MARSGEDVRLTQMLLEVAAEMDAEADAIDASAKRASMAVRKTSVTV